VLLVGWVVQGLVAQHGGFWVSGSRWEGRLAAVTVLQWWQV
jgi:hypothetical protein